MTSPTQQSLKKLRKEGWMVAVVEKYNSFTKQRLDLFNFGDLLGVRKDETLLIQTTSRSNVNARIAKICGNYMAGFWLESPTRRIVVHGWSKKGPRGKRKLWECHEVEIKPSDIKPITT